MGNKKRMYHRASVFTSLMPLCSAGLRCGDESRKPVVKKIYAVSDCGEVINKSGALQQVMGGIVDGYGHAMFGKLTFKDGAPEQNNFDNYRLIRMKEIPEIEAHFVDNGIDPTGLG